ncbi:MAG: hypothetical protein K9J17_03080 [Flavobacteriales bacterium]|nr:hypothetical protein [Flavobacteriales bacterium]
MSIEIPTIMLGIRIAVPEIPIISSERTTVASEIASVAFRCTIVLKEGS